MCICGHWLGENDELYDYPEITEIQRYGFWLRFASEHHIPCDECQEKLHKMLTTSRLAFYISNCITLEEYPKKGDWRFLLRFLPNGEQTFTPCKNCQRYILKNIDKKELHIGTDEKPLVELWRQWEIKDE